MLVNLVVAGLCLLGLSVGMIAVTLLARSLAETEGMDSGD